MNHPATPDRLLRRPSVQEWTGLTKSTLYRLVGQGAFLRPIRIGSRTVAWPESAVAAWIADRKAEALKPDAV